MLPKTIKFSIPRNHPKAGRLLKIFDALTQTRVLPSGLRIESGVENEAAVDYVIAELREVLLEADVDLNDMLEKALDRKPNPTDFAGVLSDPAMLAPILEMAFGPKKDAVAELDAALKKENGT